MKNIKKIWLYIILGNLAFVILMLIFLAYAGVLKTDSAKNMKVNYISIDYTKNMTQSLSQINRTMIHYFFDFNYKIDTSGFNKNVDNFKRYLESQENNITEKGEAQNTSLLKTKYLAYLDLINSSIRNNTHIQSVYFSKFIPAQIEITDILYNIYIENYYALIEKDNNVLSATTQLIVWICIFSDIIFTFMLYIFAKNFNTNKANTKSSKTTRSTDDYPKFYSSAGKH